MRDGVRRRAGRITVGLFAVGLAVAEARATDLKVSGVWTAQLVTNSQGQRVCGLITSYPDQRTVEIEWFEGEEVLTIQIRKTTWEIPAHVRPKVSMAFPGTNPWTAQGADVDHTTDIVEVSVPNAVVQAFTHDIANAASGTISFGGSEPPWDLSLAGFPVALQAMVKCIDDVAGPASTTTPYAYLHAPQPGTPTARGPGVGSRSSTEMGKLAQ